MPAVATLEDLQAVHKQLATLEERHPAAYADMVALFRQNRKIGYKNICKLMMGEVTPEKLKGLA